MHDVKFFHVVEWNQDLDCKPSDKSFANTLEIVQLDKLIQIHR
jgi:hypothetical protein